MKTTAGVAVDPQFCTESWCASQVLNLEAPSITKRSIVKTSIVGKVTDSQRKRTGSGVVFDPKSKLVREIYRIETARDLFS